MKTERSSSRVESVAKAATILEAFAVSTPVLSLRSLSGETGIPRSTLHGLCGTLCDFGLLELVPGHGYQLGTGLITLGNQVSYRRQFLQATQGLLTPLLQGEGTWILVGQLIGGWVVYLARMTSEKQGRVNSLAGLRVPAHQTACGKGALSLLQDDEVARRVGAAAKRDRRTPPAIPDLLRQLDQIRAAGYVVNSDFSPGRVSVGSGVIDSFGSVVGGISIGGPPTVLTVETIRRMSPRLMSIAHQIGERLPTLQARW